MLTLTIFLLAVYGLANAIAMLKIGVYLFGDPVDEVTVQGGAKMSWKSLVYKGEDLQVEDMEGHTFNIPRQSVLKILRRKGLGRIPYLGEIFYCPACLSFWIGMAASLWVLSPSAQVCGTWWKAMLLDGLMACAASWLLHAVSMKMTHGPKDA